MRELAALTGLGEERTVEIVNCLESQAWWDLIATSIATPRRPGREPAQPVPDRSDDDADGRDAEPGSSLRRARREDETPEEREARPGHARVPEDLRDVRYHPLGKDERVAVALHSPPGEPPRALLPDPDPRSSTRCSLNRRRSISPG
jgi:hypothetical protein